MSQTIDHVGFLSWAMWRCNPQSRENLDPPPLILQPVSRYLSGEPSPKKGLLLTFYFQPYDLLEYHVTNADYIEWFAGGLVPGRASRDRHPAETDQLAIPPHYQAVCAALSAAADCPAVSCSLAPDTTLDARPALLLQIFYTPDALPPLYAAAPEALLRCFARRIETALLAQESVS